MMTSCTYFGTSASEGEPIARVYNKYLYRSDLNGLLNKKVTATDSTDIINHHIESWIRRNLLLNEANKEETNNQEAINKKIEDYRASLLLFSFEQNLLKRNLDSLVTQADITAYYEANKANFKLREHVLKAQFVVVKNEAPEKENLKSWLKDDSEAGKKQLQEYCLKYAVNYSLSPSWYVFNSFISEIPIATDNIGVFLKSHTVYQTKDAVNTYVIKISDYGLKSKTAPMSFETENITKVLLNKRQIEYIKDIKEKIYQNALNNNDFEVF
ncbi:MAG: hypothetical protein ACPG5B_00480 [Chitinophagales bacterium]